MTRTYLVRLSRTVTQEGFAIVKAKSSSDARRQLRPHLKNQNYGGTPINWGTAPWAPATIGDIDEVKGD
jgi:hypothetical protein